METIIPDNIPPKFPDAFWENLGTAQAIRIYDDALQGIMQNETSSHQYSKEYAKRKANYMRRFTRGEALYSSIKGRRAMYLKNEKLKNPLKGKRTGIYAGQQVINNSIAFVNMELTGQTFRSLRTSSAPLLNGTGVKISYNPSDTDKIIGNQNRGRDIWGMRKVNQDFTFNEILKQFDETVRPIWEKNITITAG